MTKALIPNWDDCEIDKIPGTWVDHLLHSRKTATHDSMFTNLR